MLEIPQHINPREDFEEYVNWLADREDIYVEDGRDYHLGLCPECGMNEFYLHVFAEEGVVRTNCIWCGNSDSEEF